MMTGRMPWVMIVAALLACPLAAQLASRHAEDLSSSSGEATGSLHEADSSVAGGSAADANTAELDTTVMEPAEEDQQAADASVSDPQTADQNVPDQGTADQDSSAEQNQVAPAAYLMSTGPDWEGVERRLSVSPGAILSSEYRTTWNQNSQVQGSYSFLSPYVGLRFHLPRLQVGFRYSPAISYFSPSHQFAVSSAVSALEGSGIHLHFVLSRRWSVFSFANASCGEQQTQLSTYLAGSEEFEPTPLESPNPALLAAITAPNSCLIFSEAGLVWKMRRNAVTMTFGETYSTETGLQSTGVGAVRLSLYHGVTPSSTVNVYLHVSHDFLNDSTCEGVGSGAGLRHKFSRRISWSGEVGPDLRNCGAGQWIAGASFATSLDVKLRKQTNLSLTAGREFYASYIDNPTWLPVYLAYGSMRQPLGRTTSFEVDGGFLSIQGVSSYFVSPRFRWRMDRHIDLIAMYVRNGDIPGNDNNRLAIALHWHPGGMPLRRVFAEMR